nr:30S ribosomal protein S20 [Mycoplasmopsis bovis]
MKSIKVSQSKKNLDKETTQWKLRVRKAIRVMLREAVLAKEEGFEKKVFEAHSIIATAVQKGIYHPNKGARKSSRLESLC